MYQLGNTGKALENVKKDLAEEVYQDSVVLAGACAHLYGLQLLERGLSVEAEPYFLEAEEYLNQFLEMNKGERDPSTIHFLESLMTQEKNFPYLNKLKSMVIVYIKLFSISRYSTRLVAGILS